MTHHQHSNSNSNNKNWKKWIRTRLRLNFVPNNLPPRFKSAQKIGQILFGARFSLLNSLIVSMDKSPLFQFATMLYSTVQNRIKSKCHSPWANKSKWYNQSNSDSKFDENLEFIEEKETSFDLIESERGYLARADWSACNQRDTILHAFGTRCVQLILQTKWFLWTGICTIKNVA